MNVDALYNGHKTYWWDPTLRWQAPRGGMLQGCVGCGVGATSPSTTGDAAMGVFMMLALVGVAGLATYLTKDW